VALLKDSHGVIDLNIPIRGSLDDPKFSVMPLVGKALGHLFVKAVTAPFKLLGKLFGGGHKDELNYVVFAPGVDSLSQGEQEKLDSLAKALTERPELKMDIRGGAVQSLDHAALATRKIGSVVVGEGASFTPAQATKAQRDRLYKLYTETFAEDAHALVSERNDSGKAVPREQRETMVADTAYRRLVAEYPVAAEDLRDLAQRRAAAVKDRLIAVGKIEEARLFLQDVDVQSATEGESIKTELTLDAR
jgi:hypothetical protein